MNTKRPGASPFLHALTSAGSASLPPRYPFSLPVFKEGIDLRFDSPITFFVGANGSGKSTLLEAIAHKCEFNPAGGNKMHLYEMPDTTSELGPHLQAMWVPRRVTEGFFFRAETLFNYLVYINEDPYIRKAPYYFGESRQSIHDQSHGETFLALFANRFGEGIYILDEPEAALSPSAQLAFMAMMRQMEVVGNAQFIIATHSPMLICYPGATVYSFTKTTIEQVDYRETEHYKLTKEFLNNPEQYLYHLFQASEDE